MDHEESRVDQSSAVSMADMLKHVSITILECDHDIIAVWQYIGIIKGLGFPGSTLSTTF